MIKAINSANNNTVFRSKPEKEVAKDETRILPDNLKTRTRQASQKTANAFFYYPVRGLRGDINSNFYEFLTMGIVPYLAGSAMFMAVFNLKGATFKGKKMALGVLMYALLKTLSKPLVTKPIELATGVNTEMPYQNKVYQLPKEAGEDASIDVQYQQRKVFDSNEFYRKDLLDQEYFDKVGKRLGLGENLNDSRTEVSPIIQNIVATSNTAKSLSTFAWAGVGVALASQDAWAGFFDSISGRKKYIAKTEEGFFSKMGNKAKTLGENFINVNKEFGKSFVESSKTLWNGPAGSTGYMKHAGKAFVGAAAALTVGLTANTIIRAKALAKKSNKNTIDKSKESTVI